MPSGSCVGVERAGAAPTMAAAPSVPPTPGLFSMITGTPRVLLALSAKARMTPSLLPTAGPGAISLRGRLGNLSCANACVGRSAGAATAAAADRIWRRLKLAGRLDGWLMRCLLLQ